MIFLAVYVCMIKCADFAYMLWSFPGIRHEAFDDSRLNAQASISTSSSYDAGFTEQDGGSMSLCRTTCDDSRVRNGALEILGLWRLLGDGYRLICMYKCQVIVFVGSSN